MKRLILFIPFFIIFAGCTAELGEYASEKATEGVKNVLVGAAEKLLDSVTSNVDKVVKTSDENFVVKVKEVIDGDTIKISCDIAASRLIEIGKNTDAMDCSNGLVSVRILNIDTPEIHGPKAIQPFGPEASEFAKKNLSGKNIEIEVSAKESPFDNYGRLLAYIFVDGELYQEKIVKDGLARIAYIYQPDTKYLDRLEEAETYAKENGLGIWSIPNYVQQNGFSLN